MVKTTDGLPTNPQGQLDLAQWLEDCMLIPGMNETGAALVNKAGQYALAHGANLITPLGLSAFRQGLEIATMLKTLEPDAATLATGLLDPLIRLEPNHLNLLTAEGLETPKRLLEGLQFIEQAEIKRSAPQVDKVGQDNLRKMLLAMVEDVRVVLIKLAERLVVLRRAATLETPVRQQVAEEIMSIYAPLANRLGIGQIKWELEDLSFRYLNPAAYKNIARLLDERRIDREQFIKQVVVDLKERLAEDSIDAQVYGRAKHIYSIWRKMLRKGLDFNDIYDVRAIRILVDDLKECYAALGIVHSLWCHIPQEFDDYIATPKENGYRSLHTAVYGQDGRAIEIQIRTKLMHQEAELGVAAHWAYKEGQTQDGQYQQKLNNMRQVLEFQAQLAESEKDAPDDDDIVRDMLADKVYVFTPKGEIKVLPNEATPLDFAYHVHTEIGHRCRGAKVNGVMVPLNTKLNSGDQVEIITANEARPSRDWLNQNLGYLHSSRSRAKIQHWFKIQDRDFNIQHGRTEFERELKRLGLDMPNLQSLAQHFKLPSSDDFLAALGGGDIRLVQLYNLLQPKPTEKSEDVIPVKAPSSKALRANRGDLVAIEGVGSLMHYMAKCCKPVPGDRIIGFVTQGRGVAIHRDDCPNILAEKHNEDPRIIQVNWCDGAEANFAVDVRVRAYDRQGLLKDITNVLSATKVNVLGVNTMTEKSTHIAQIRLNLEVKDFGQLAKILSKIEQLPNVIEANRIHAN